MGVVRFLWRMWLSLSLVLGVVWLGTACSLQQPLGSGTLAIHVVNPTRDLFSGQQLFSRMLPQSALVSTFSPPSGLPDFGCYVVNISGPGIAANYRGLS